MSDSTTLTHISNLVTNHGFASGINRLFRHIAIRIPLQILPVQNVPPENINKFFEFRSYIFPRVSDKNPMDLLWVEPKKINYIHNLDYPRPPDRYGYIIGGDWDQHIILFDDHFIHQSLVDRYQHDMEWEQTELYKKYTALLQDGDTPRGIQSMKELKNYLSNVDSLYNNIDKKGYKTQLQLLKENPEMVHQQNNDACHPILNEICVNISRDGELIKRGSGHHRLSIAKILNIDKVPVIVKTRHKEWQHLRDTIRTANSISDLNACHKQYLNHPDMMDVQPINME